MTFFRGLLNASPFCIVFWLIVVLLLSGCSDRLATGWVPSKDHAVVVYVLPRQEIVKLWYANPANLKAYGKRNVAAFADTQNRAIYLSREHLDLFAHELRHIEEGDWHP